LLLAARVASINLCTDEYLLLLARPQEIVSVSYLSQEPLESPLWRTARRHHANHGSVEQVLRTRPSLLLNMGGGGRASALIAGRLKMRTLDLPPPSSVKAVGDNLKAVAEALGDRRRADPWLARLAKLRRTQPVVARDAVLLTGGGRSVQQGSPAIEWLRLAGLQQRPLPEGRASLEMLLTRPPAVLVESSYRRKQVSRGTAWLDHPVVRNTKARRLRTDGRAWTCLGPLMIPEIERLRASAR
jgi:iron complex transport system substrate-binding protein